MSVSISLTATTRAGRRSMLCRQKNRINGLKEQKQNRRERKREASMSGEERESCEAK